MLPKLRLNTKQSSRDSIRNILVALYFLALSENGIALQLGAPVNKCLAFCPTLPFQPTSKRQTTCISPISEFSLDRRSDIPNSRRTMKLHAISSSDDQDVYPDNEEVDFGSYAYEDDDYEDRQSALRSLKEQDEDKNKTPEDEEDEMSRRARIRRRVTELARNIIIKPISYAAPMPQAIASVLKDATLGALDMAVEEVIGRRGSRKIGKNSAGQLSPVTSFNVKDVDVTALIEEAFQPLENSLQEMEDALKKARSAFNQAKLDAIDAVGAVQAAAIAHAEGAATAVAAAEEKVIADIIYNYAAEASDVNVSALNFNDVEWTSESAEMAPPFLDEQQCLVPGEPVVRVEKAPENSRRIYAGIDIMTSTDDVWNVLTDYQNLQKAVPNLVVNDVLELYNYDKNYKGLDNIVIDGSKPEEVQCQELSKQMKGALLRQVGGARVAGIQFSARTTLEVREWPHGLPDFAHFRDEMWQGKSRKQRADEYAKVKLQRYRFPRPFALSSLTEETLEDIGIVSMYTLKGIVDLTTRKSRSNV